MFFNLWLSRVELSGNAPCNRNTKPGIIHGVSVRGLSGSYVLSSNDVCFKIGEPYPEHKGTPNDTGTCLSNGLESDSHNICGLKWRSSCMLAMIVEHQTWPEGIGMSSSLGLRKPLDRQGQQEQQKPQATCLVNGDSQWSIHGWWQPPIPQTISSVDVGWTALSLRQSNRFAMDHLDYEMLPCFNDHHCHAFFYTLPSCCMQKAWTMPKGPTLKEDGRLAMLPWFTRVYNGISLIWGSQGTWCL